MRSCNALGRSILCFESNLLCTNKRCNMVISSAAAMCRLRLHLNRTNSCCPSLLAARFAFVLGNHYVGLLLPPFPLPSLHCSYLDRVSLWQCSLSLISLIDDDSLIRFQGIRRIAVHGMYVYIHIAWFSWNARVKWCDPNEIQQFFLEVWRN